MVNQWLIMVNNGFHKLLSSLVSLATLRAHWSLRRKDPMDPMDPDVCTMSIIEHCYYPLVN